SCTVLRCHIVHLSIKRDSYEFFILLSIILKRPKSTLFPYTTLFRSEKPQPIFPRLKMDEEVKYIKDEMAKAKPKKTTRRTKEGRSEEHTSELQSRFELVCRLLLEKKKKKRKRKSKK